MLTFLIHYVASIDDLDNFHFLSRSSRPGSGRVADYACLNKFSNIESVTTTTELK